MIELSGAGYEYIMYRKRLYERDDFDIVPESVPLLRPFAPADARWHLAVATTCPYIRRLIMNFAYVASAAKVLGGAAAFSKISPAGQGGGRHCHSHMQAVASCPLSLAY